MEREFVKRYVTKDGKQRVSIYQDEYADNPRDTTDEPFHCEDWCRDYSIMITNERANCNRTSSARSLLGYMFREYGDHKKALEVLFENGKHMTDGKEVCNDALAYNRSTKEWEHLYYGSGYDYETAKNIEKWHMYNSWCCKKEDIDIYDVIDSLCDSTIDYLVEHCMTDKVKMMSYGFGYYGGLSFYDEVTCDAEGICWLEKDEFLKYSGNGEDFWKEKSLREIEFLIEELEAWSENEVYYFDVETKHSFTLHKEYIDEDRDNEDIEDEEWEVTDSCSGFYGELDKSLDWILETAGFKKEELEEVA